jgi:RNA polymerase sigma-70 factor (ECF subfamily)
MSVPPNPEAISLALARPSTTGPAKCCRLRSEILELFEHSRKGLFLYLRGMGIRDHDAEEVIQEVFLALFQNLRRGQTYNNLRGWTFRVAHNLGLKHQNAERRRSAGDETIFLRQIDPGPDPEQQVNARQKQEKLLAVFDSLPEQDQRDCVIAKSLRPSEFRLAR